MTLRPLPTLAIAFAVALLATPPALRAESGLAQPDVSSLWPQLQLRLSLQSLAPAAASSRPWSLLPGPDAAAGARTGAVFGDYVFAAPRFGQFRATSGLVLGSAIGDTTAADRVTRPYLGLGYSLAGSGSGLSLVADVGVVAENFSALGQWARAAERSQSFEQTLREMRWTPVLQLGLRWSF